MRNPTERGTATIDYRDAPAYTIAESARYLRISPTTLAAWVKGSEHTGTADKDRRYRLIVPATSSPTLLSFWNLIEAHVLRGLRIDHRVQLKTARKALDYAKRELGIDRLLLDKQLQAAAGELFTERYGTLIQLSRAGQIALKQVFDAHLQRVEWDEWQFPVRLYPFMSSSVPSEPKSVAIDPGIAFGRPIVPSRGITTEVLAARIDAGEDIEDVAADYKLSVTEVEQAILYERAA
jgi:uncharacterized protein (DUF433 family)